MQGAQPPCGLVALEAAHGEKPPLFSPLGLPDPSTLGGSPFHRTCHGGLLSGLYDASSKRAFGLLFLKGLPGRLIRQAAGFGGGAFREPEHYPACRCVALPRGGLQVPI